MNTKKHFVFDLDDTLIDGYSLNQQAFVDTFASYIDVLDPAVDEYLRTLHFHSRGISMHEQFFTAVTHFALNVEIEDLLSANEEFQLQNADKITLFFDVAELLKVLKAKHKSISICSNRQGPSLVRMLKTLGIFDYFTNVISCADAGFEKPDPYCLNKIISDSKDPEEAFIYFGDSKTDYEFAKAAGVDAVIIDHYLNQKKFYRMIIESFI